MKNLESASTTEFETVARRYLEEKEATVTTATYDVYVKNLEDFILPNFDKAYDIEEISTPEILALLEKKFQEKGYSKFVINRLITFVRSVVRFHRKTTKYENIASINKKNTFNLLTKKEVKAIYKMAVANAFEHKYIGLLLAMFTGMPISEICALKWNDIDFEHKLICVSRDVNRMPYPKGEKQGNKKTFVEVKEKNARKVPIHNELEKILVKHYDKSNNYCYIISDSKGIVEPRTLEMFVKKTFDGSFTIGDLRDWFFIKSIQKGIPLQVLASITGVTLTHIIKRYELFFEVSEDDMKLQINKLMVD